MKKKCEAKKENRIVDGVIIIVYAKRCTMRH